jgi:chromosome segregation ATPase
MDDSRDAHRAMQVESLRDEVISLRTVSFESQKLRARVAELEAARKTLDSALAETRRVLADQSVQAAELASAQARLAELEEQVRLHRYTGLKLAAIRAEAEYLREEFGAVRWSLEQELSAARNSLTDVTATLEQTQVELHTTQEELAAHQATLRKIERSLTFRVRRLGGNTLRRLGLWA